MSEERTRSSFPLAAKVAREARRMGVAGAKFKSPRVTQGDDPTRNQTVGHLKYLNRQGHHFRRQAPIDGYIVDFAEFSHRLIIEVDGSQHGFAKGEASDRLRNEHFTEAGFRVLHFWNYEIDQSMDGVIDAILTALPPSGSLRSPPSPQRGKDKS